MDLESMIRFLKPQLPAASEIERYFEMSRNERWFSNDGPCLRLFVERSQGLLGRGLTLVPTASCTLALMLGLRVAAGWPTDTRREVVLPSFTFPATAGAVAWCGFSPVFADVDPGAWHLSPGALRDILDTRGDRVAGIVACSTFGTPPSREVSRAWADIAADAGVPLIVDSAAGFGARDELGELLGAQGQVEVFSFHATKPFAIGEGGALTTSDPSLAAAVRRLSNFGFGADRSVDEPGINAKLDEWHAAAALAGLDGLDSVLAARRVRAERMREALTPHGFVFQEGSERGTWQFVPVLAPSESVRSDVRDHAPRAAIEVRGYFDPPLHRLAAFAGSPSGPLEVTDSLSRRMLSLPMANDLSDDAVDAVIECLVDPAAAPDLDLTGRTVR